MSAPTPSSVQKDLIESGLAKLAKITHVDLRDANSFKVGQTVQLPSANEPHVGTVSATNPLGFQVTYMNTGRKHGQPRDKHWYKWSEARHFEAVSHG